MASSSSSSTSALTVLTDQQVRQILRGISPAQAEGLARTLEDAFVQYSCRGDAEFQPHRSVVCRPPGHQTNLFMPATTPSRIGVKIIGVPSSSAPAPAPAPADDNDDHGGGGDTQHTQQTAGSTKSTKAGGGGLKSILTLCDDSGRPVGVLNAAELTGFRTALGSILLYRHRRHTEKIVVFGAGKQAEWHIRLAVLLRGQDIREITIVNRNRDRTRALIESLAAGSSGDDDDDNGEEWPSHIQLKEFSVSSGGHDDDDEGDGAGRDDGGGRDDDASWIEQLVVAADVIFFTTGSKRPLFPAEFLLSDRARQKTRYLGAIGSYTLDMAEIDPDLITAVGQPQGPLASQVWQGGHVVVDSREACLHEAGEFVKSGLGPDRWLDVGRVVDMTRQGSSLDGHAELREWLEAGFVIYKSVGVGIMDIAIGSQVLELAGKKKVGVRISNF